MRIFQALFKKNSRPPQNPKRVPLSAPRLPFGLKNKVSTRKDNARAAPCQQQLQDLLTKLEKNDFNQTLCQNEVEALSKAHAASYEQYCNERAERRIGEIKPGSTLNGIPLNKYLKKFPISKMDEIESEIKKKFVKK